MSKRDFTPEEFAARAKRVRGAIAAANLDWLVMFHPVSIHWLTGSDAKSYQEFQCLFLSAKPGPMVVIAREGERNEYRDDTLADEIFTFGGGENEDAVPVFAKVASAFGLPGARVGMEVPAYYIHPHDYIRVRDFLGAALVAEPTTLVHDLKLVKSPAEIAYIREAARKADNAMERFAGTLREGRSELAMAGEIHASLLADNSLLAASPINLVSGERSSFSHGAPTERRLRRGDAGNVEYGATHRRYTSTIGRQFNLGPPTARVAEIYAVARAACDACMAAIRDGVPAVQPHEAAKRVIGEAGMERYRVHTSGYGLAPGFPPTWGEPMHMIGGSTYTLSAGMVVSVEPPVFIGEERIGARIIDNVLVTANGCELLSRFSRDIIVA
jgi:Xaa-Pro dipeptidase